MVNGILLGFCLVITFCFFTYFIGRRMEYMTEQLVKNRTTTINNIHIYGNLTKHQIEELARKCDIAFLKDQQLIEETTIDIKENQEVSLVDTNMEKNIGVNTHAAPTSYEAPTMTGGSNEDNSSYIEVDLGDSEQEIIQLLRAKDNGAGIKSATTAAPLKETNSQIVDESEQEQLNDQGCKNFTSSLWAKWEIPEQYRPLPSLTWILNENPHGRDGCLGRIYKKRGGQVLFGDTRTQLWLRADRFISIPDQSICYCDIDLNTKTVKDMKILEPFTKELVDFQAA